MMRAALIHDQPVTFREGFKIMHKIGITLTQFIIEEQRKFSGASGEFTGLLNDVATACKKISSLTHKGDLVGVLGAAGSDNVQGEQQKKMAHRAIRARNRQRVQRFNTVSLESGSRRTRQNRAALRSESPSYRCFPFACR